MSSGLNAGPNDAVIIEAVRSPGGKGKPGGALSSVHPADLLAQVLVDLVERTGIDPGLVEDVLVGCVNQSGEQSATPGRMAWLAAGFPEHVPSVTIERKCGSGQQAAQFAAQGVLAGAYDIVIAGGVESMSRVPLGSARMGADPFGDGVNERYAPGLVSQGVSAELVAQRWDLSRDQLDEYSARSHARAAQARDSGAFDREITPIRLADGTVVAVDEGIREDTTVERLAGLKTPFDAPDVRDRFPEVDFRVTAGNSSQITDGASAMLITSRATAERLGLRPRARFHAFSQVGDDPLLMLTGVIPSTHKVLARAGMSIGDIDLFEVNEAFAPVPLAWQAEFGVSDDDLNVNGGAIALGHPLGASGGRITATLLNTMETRGARWGLQTMCEAGGMANATIIERLDD